MFAGLVALSSRGIIGVWNTMTQNWKVQHVQPITSYDIAGMILQVWKCKNATRNRKYKRELKDPLFVFDGSSLFNRELLISSIHFVVTAFDFSGCTLILGCSDGCVYSVDMAKFPLRMKDNDLLVSKLYGDPERSCGISISAIR